MVLPSRRTDEDKKAKAVKMSKGVTTSGNHADGHKKPRRSHRPIIAKGKKAARLAAEAEATVLAETSRQLKEKAQKVKLLRKISTRQKDAGKTAEAAETIGQIEALNAEMRLLEMDLVAMAGGDAQMDDAEDGAAAADAGGGE